MKITVILCTYNRCESLRNALASVAASVMPDSVVWDVVVVDNNSKDETRLVIGEFCRRYPDRFRYVFESQSGKSHALTAGLQQARGQILAFMDDDVTVEPMWLQTLTAPLSRGPWVGSGGRILPQRDFPMPKWLPVQDRYGLAPLALFDLGSDAGPLTEAPFGTNMAFRREMFQKYGGFRTDLGPQPGSEIRNEDTEFGGRLLDAGEKLRYVPAAVVYHAIPEGRLQKKFFLAWWYDKARADIRTFGTPSQIRWFIAGVPLIFFRRLIVWTLRWMVAIGAAKRFSCRLKVWGAMGQVSECFSGRRFHGGNNRVQDGGGSAAALTLNTAGKRDV